MRRDPIILQWTKIHMRWQRDASMWITIAQVVDPSGEDVVVIVEVSPCSFTLGEVGVDEMVVGLGKEAVVMGDGKAF